MLKSIFKTKEEVLIDSTIKCLHGLVKGKNIHFQEVCGSIGRQIELLQRLAINQRWASRQIFDALCDTKVLIGAAPNAHFEALASLLTKLDEVIIEIKHL